MQNANIYLGISTIFWNIEIQIVYFLQCFYFLTVLRYISIKNIGQSYFRGRVHLTPAFLEPVSGTSLSQYKFTALNR